MAKNKKVVSIENRIPELKKYRKKKLVRQLVLLIGFFTLLILITLYFLSPLSKVGTIYVTGNRELTEQEVRTASGIEKGDYVIAINNRNTVSEIKKNPLIKKATVTKRGFNEIEISITEYKTIGYEPKNGFYYDILENGKLLTDSSRKFPIGNRVLFVRFKNGELLTKMVKEWQKLPSEVQSAVSEIHLEPKKSDPEHLLLYMNDGNQVSATIESFSEKMIYYPSIAAQLNPGQKGVIDLEVGAYFESYYKQNQSEKANKKK
ncbi:cell division protein FtsQ [Listeria floridensis FSL S10-1187]|uniref:Cell division protein DivIB n=1 Tax=Listeria floridensis FSL S10-1187 TaxID=1265817 RepID=A0ABP3B073_9LIST|nr:cell division protein FtsQ/DivIB [Listeria floridensis]EUJ32079.1 cell division protein FtsQ [Listeria floridensis FSL S10-1187]